MFQERGGGGWIGKLKKILNKFFLWLWKKYSKFKLNCLLNKNNLMFGEIFWMFGNQYTFPLIRRLLALIYMSFTGVCAILIREKPNLVVIILNNCFQCGWYTVEKDWIDIGGASLVRGSSESYTLGSPPQAFPTWLNLIFF